VFYVNKDDIKLPYALSVTNVTPPTVKIKLDATASRSVPVKPVLTGEPRNGFVVSSVRVEPQSVVIRGLASDVRKLHSVNTEPLDITDSDGTITQELNIDTGGIKVTPDIEMVNITVNISRHR
jgi:YbbR domain-containing protein